MASLKDWDVVKLSTLITNVNAKLSASTKTGQRFQILCLVRQNDQILFRYIDRNGDVHLMLLCWFADNQKGIQDVCFDSTGNWLLVFCYDNTLHIVPALSVCDKSMELDTTFNQDEITSFIVPFIGPHECPNPQTCPNNSHNHFSSSAASHRSSIASESSLKTNGTNVASSTPVVSAAAPGTANTDLTISFDGPTLKKSSSTYTTHKIDEIFSLNSIYRQLFLEQLEKTKEQQSAQTISADTPIAMQTIEDFFADAAGKEQQASDAVASKSSTPQETYTISSSLESAESTSCPYPTCCTWWKTLSDEPRAILGYSDGAICVVALTPNCPFLGNTNCERGSIEKLIICQDNSMETISLMINTSTKEQWKLLLEQKSIKYTFPGDITPTSSHDLKAEMTKSLSDDKQDSGTITDDWQIVLNLPKDGTVSPESGNPQQQPSGNSKDCESSGSSPNSSEPPSGDDFERLENDATADGDKGPDNGQGSLPKLFPAAKARLLSLRNLGAKKIGTLKLKLSESRIKAKEKEKLKEQAANLAVMELPGMFPEILTTPAGPYFVVQYMDGKYLLSALHSYSDTLSVHSMDISLIPLHIYKVPKLCQSTVLTRNVIYVLHSMSDDSQKKSNSPNSEDDAGSDFQCLDKRTSEDSIEHLEQTNSNSVETSSTDAEPNAVSVVSCKISAMKMGDDCDFNEHSLLGVFRFADERVLDIHRVATIAGHTETSSSECYETSATPTGPETNDSRSVFQKSAVSNYLKIQKGLRMDRKLDTHESQVMISGFPRVEYDQVLIVTDKNLYTVELSDTPRNLFLRLAHKCIWAACEDFCTTFGISLAGCIEYSGDVLLRRKRISEALMTYNVARLSPMRTALKLAMMNENKALMKLCTMALRNSHITNSQYLMHDIMKILVDEAHLGNVVYDSLINLNAKATLKPINAGAQCSDFSYENDDIPLDVQISPADQFHLSNLMFLTLCERCITDKNYIPLWNFLVTNSKYHTSLACIMLAHGKLYSSATLLAMTRGTCLDVYSCLVGIWEQVIESTPEVNAYVFNLSSELFMECLIYLQDYTIQYLEMVRKCIDKFDINVLERLIHQLNPFHPVYRPLMHKLSNHDSAMKELDRNLLYFCKALIETFLALTIRLQSVKMHNECFLNALKHVRVYHDEMVIEMKMSNFSPIAAGFSHAACVVGRVAYIWGANGTNCALSRTSLQGDPIGPNGQPPYISFIKQLDLEVIAVQCGRLHTVILTNNGVYSMGANNLNQLGIGNHVINALQPMLVKSLDGKCVTHLAVGQYHNAVVANGLLYTWGWGVFGQLGHGTVDDQPKPKVVDFFRNKVIQQIALGHAHTLVLCRNERQKGNSLYVFGSNHYGQLGLGQEDRFNSTVDTRNGKTFLISLIPRRIDLGEDISLINTKLFVNLVLTISNKLYTWGSSPQALRLATQARKRSKSSTKGSGLAKMNSLMKSSKAEHAEAASKAASSSQKDAMPNVSSENDDPNLPPKDKDMKETKETAPDAVDDKDSTTQGEKMSTNIPEIKIEDTSEEEKVVQPVPDEKPQQPSTSDEATEHLFPTLVDTSLVEDKIVKISSGLYHFALVTSDSYIYTWGKNIERQLGREGDRNEVLLPSRLDITGVLYVECGADFTMVMMEDFGVRTWGNNNMGQCAKEISLDRNGAPGKVVRLPISNRLVRIPDSSQFIEMPHTVRLPVNDGSCYRGPVRFLKSLPKFRRNYVIKSALEKVISNNISTISSSLNDVSNTETDDMVGELPSYECRLLHQNASTMSSLQSVSYATSPTSLAIDDEEEEEDGALEEMEPEEFGSSENSSHLFSERYLLSNDFIHYCLYIFHGLYGQEVVLQLTKRCNEYHIRMMMLNYDYVEAFRLILELLSSSLSSSATPASIAKQTMNLVKIFEYFTKDSNIIPMDMANIRYFIYELFTFFIKHNLNLDVLEEFFLRNIDCYLVQLAFVLYFNNINNLTSGTGTNVDSEVLALERRLLDKFNNNGNQLLANELFGGGLGQASPDGGNTPKVVRKLENTEAIAKSLTAKFNVIVCQKLIEHFDRLK